MFVQLGAQPQADFTQPLELMMDCHRRIEHFLDVLLHIARTGAGKTATAEQRTALETALNYFRSAGPRHNADEEQSLFPRLRSADDPNLAGALAAVEQLEADHRHVEAQHERVDVLVTLWLDHSRLSPGESSELIELLTEMRETYRRHIQVEDQELFPLARRLLEESQLQQIGREMAERRDKDPGRPGSRCAARRKCLDHPNI